MARKVLALAFRNAIASPGANPGRAVACASELDEDRLIDIRNDEGAGGLMRMQLRNWMLHVYQELELRGALRTKWSV